MENASEECRLIGKQCMEKTNSNLINGLFHVLDRDLCQNYTCADSNSYCIVHCRNISCLCSKGFEKSSASMKCRGK